MTKNTEYVLARFEYKNEYLHILKEAEEAVKDYSSYKSKNIPATKDQSDMIESCHALSQLRVIALKLQLREITVGEIDFPKLKAIIPSSFICKKTLEYLRKTCDTLIACFLEARYLVLARVFVMIHSYCVANMRYRSSKIDFSQDNLALDKLIIEFNYAKTVLVLSYELDKYNIDISQEQLEDEQIFVKVLKTIGIDVNVYSLCFFNLIIYFSRIF